MDIFEQVQKMRLFSFSEEERHRYQAEKMMLRQFMLMKQQDKVPEYLSVRDMKTWLLRGRSFLVEFQEIIEQTNKSQVYFNQMEQELLEELDKEEQLSQLLGRKVTLEGLQMFVSVIRPIAEEDVQTYLFSLHSRLLRLFGDIHITSGQLRSGDIKPAQLMELEKSAVPLVPEVVNIALKFLLEEPEHKNKSEAASAEIGKLLSHSAATCHSQFRRISEALLLGVCTSAARSMVRAISKRFDECSKSFHQMELDESFFSARESVISTIQEMDPKVQTAASSQAHLQLSTSEGLKDQPLEEREASLEVASSVELEEELVEKREAFPQVSVEDVATMASPTDKTEDTSLTKLEVNVTVHFDDELAHPHLSTSEGLKDQLLEEREASPGVFVGEEVAAVQNNVNKDRPAVRLQSNVIVYMDDELEVLEQEEAEASEPQESLAQDCHVKKKKGLGVFFCRLWKTMTCCFSVSTKD